MDVTDIKTDDISDYYNITGYYVTYYTPDIWYITIFVISMLTVVFNGLILYYLRIKRDDISKMAHLQTFCLCVTDLIAGLSLLVFSLDWIRVINRNYFACVVILTVFSSSQLSVLLNVCMLSIKRWIALRKVTLLRQEVSEEQGSQILIYIKHILCPWVISLLLHIPVAALWMITNMDASANGCISPKMTNDSKIMAALGLFFTIALTPLTLSSTMSLLRLKLVVNANDYQIRRHQMHRNAFKHLLCVLIVTNILSLPFIIGLIIRSFDDGRKKYLYLLVLVQTLNSLLNPIIASVYVSAIRAAMRVHIRIVCRTLATFFTSNNTVAPVTDRHDAVNTTAVTRVQGTE